MLRFYYFLFKSKLASFTPFTKLIAVISALFLLDNDTEIWLWEGWKTSESNGELYEMVLELAKETANNYAKEKGSIPVKHVLAGLEPLDFINIFPYWNKRNDIAEIQCQHK